MIKFKPDFILPHFLLKLDPISDISDKSDLELEEIIADSSEMRFTIEFANVNPPPYKCENDDFLTVLLGAPIVGDKIDFEGTLSLIGTNSSIDREGVLKLNGEFLIIKFNKKTSELTVINDRYTSLPFFYYNGHNRSDKTFYASIYFSDLWAHLKKTGKLEFDHNAFFEFLWFQRLFGTKTYAKDTLFLPDASILTLSSGSADIQRYWQRNYEKSEKSFSEHVEMMEELLKHSICRKSSDGKRFGIFLSGGMDSRSVLSAFPDERLPVCFTSTVNENREFRTAAKIAETRGAEHIGLELDQEHFGKIFRHSTNVIGGMYNYDHGLFYGFNDIVRKHVDVCFHGHGFDYMFQGMYIPGNDVVIGGRHLYLRFMKQLPEDLVSYFINNVSYRVKNADIWSFVTENKKTELQDYQRSSIEEIYNNGKKLTGDSNALWEYLTFHHISRHYSYPNHASIATFAEQRTVSFDNELFDLYHALPFKHRFNGKIEKACLVRLNPEIASIHNANTNLPVTASCWKQTVYQLAGFLKRRIVPETEKGAEWQERTWPSRDYALREQESLKKAVKKLCSSDIFEQLNFLNMNKIRTDVPKWIDGEDIAGISGDLVQTLLTLGTFLEL